MEASSKQKSAASSAAASSSTVTHTTMNGHSEGISSRQNGKTSNKQITNLSKPAPSSVPSYPQANGLLEQQPPRREPPLPQKPFTRILPSTNGKPFDRNAPVFVRRQRVHLNGQLRKDLFLQANTFTNPNEIDETNSSFSNQQKL